jgi:hypothetical protein
MFGAAAGSALLLPTRKFFLPPVGGWWFAEQEALTRAYQEALRRAHPNFVAIDLIAPGGDVTSISWRSANPYEVGDIIQFGGGNRLWRVVSRSA